MFQVYTGDKNFVTQVHRFFLENELSVPYLCTVDQ